MVRKSLIFCTAIGFTVMCGAVAIAICVYGPEHPSPFLHRMFESCADLFVVGVASVLTLVSIEASAGPSRRNTRR